MQNSKNILFIRHAESVFNLAQKLATNSLTEVALGSENLDVKFSDDLTDCPLSERGIQQCVEARDQLFRRRIDYVLVSPMLRTIETAHHLLKDHPSQPKFIAEPYLREMTLSSCDIGANLEYAMEQYPYIDFKRMSQIPYPFLWNLEYLQDQNTSEMLKELLQRKCQENNEKFDKSSTKYLTQYMKNIHPRQIETFLENQMRIQKVREILIQEYIMKLPEDSCIVVVSHSRTLNTLSATKFDEEGIPMDGIWWENCDFRELVL